MIVRSDVRFVPGPGAHPRMAVRRPMRVNDCVVFVGDPVAVVVTILCDVQVEERWDGRCRQ